MEVVTSTGALLGPCRKTTPVHGVLPTAPPATIRVFSKYFSVPVYVSVTVLDCPSLSVSVRSSFHSTYASPLQNTVISATEKRVYMALPNSIGWPLSCDEQVSRTRSNNWKINLLQSRDIFGPLPPFFVETVQNHWLKIPYGISSVTYHYLTQVGVNEI